MSYNTRYVRTATGILDSTTGVEMSNAELATLMSNIPQAAEADLAGGAVLADVIAKVNAILAKLRTAGIIAT